MTELDVGSEFVILCIAEYWEGKNPVVIGTYPKKIDADYDVDHMPKEGEHGYCENQHVVVPVTRRR